MSLILYKDKYCVIANKPNNVLVHHAYHSRNKSDEESLLQLLLKEINQTVYPIHRLDRKTSGIILLANQKEYVSQFQKLFTTNAIQKTYYGIARGFTPDTKIIDSPVKGRDSDVYKDAETHLKTLQKAELNIPVKPYKTSRYSLVELSPKTGRLHQLRIHMSKISHPLINDPKYGDKNHNLLFEEQFNALNLFLHAGILTFKHPFTDKDLQVKSTFPVDWLTIFSKFDWKNPLTAL